MKKRDYSFITSRGGREHNVTGVTNKPTQSLRNEKLKLYFDIPTWMRDQGIEDNETFTAEDVQDLLQFYFNDIEKKFDSLFSQEQKRVISETLEIVESHQMQIDLHSPSGKRMISVIPKAAFDNIRREALNKLEKEIK